MQLGCPTSRGVRGAAQLLSAGPSLRSHWGPCLRASRAQPSRRVFVEAGRRTPEQTYAVRRFAPPQDDLGAVTVADTVANGDSLSLNGTEFVVARVATNYVLRKGRYEVSSSAAARWLRLTHARSVTARLLTLLPHHVGSWRST